MTLPHLLLLVTLTVLALITLYLADFMEAARLQDVIDNRERSSPTV